MKKVLITGVSGFVGQHLKDYCLSQDCEVHGMCEPSSKKFPILITTGNLRLHEADVESDTLIRELILSIKPDIIFHLAAETFVPYCTQKPLRAVNVNIKGTITLLEAIKDHAPNAVVLIPSSSEAYGLVLPEEIPVNEETPFRPITVYGVTKATQDMLAFQYYKSYGLNIVRTRSFNHEGVGRGSQFVTSSLIDQVLKVKEGKADKILVGNLNAIRDFCDVRDVVKAYWMLTNNEITRGQAYNVCSGAGTKIEMLLHHIMFKVLKSVDPLLIAHDLTKMRLSDIPVMIGDNSKIKYDIGWEPLIPLEQTIADMVDDKIKKMRGCVNP